MEPPSSDEPDLDFLRALDRAEFDALSVLSSKPKRQRVTVSQEDEGAYTFALKGSHSAQWKESDLRRKRTSGSDSSVRSEGGCFKCGEMGHWARNCPSAGKGSGPVRAGTGEEDEPCRECPCGAGRCSVFTSNTAKNPGRKFLRCPVKSDMGGCNFFQWCDDPQTTGVAHAGPTNPMKPSVAGIPCPCGAGSCLILTTKNGQNAGRQFYRCPATSGEGLCGFFKWCETDQSLQPAQIELSDPSYSSPSYLSGQISSGGRGSSSSCFRCGDEGHWARDCPKTPSQTPDLLPHRASKPLSSNVSGSGSPFGSGSGSDTCFKCGQADHWSRDCPSKTYSVRK